MSSTHSPFYSFGKSRLQYIYTASELLQTGMKPGTIRTISWRVLQLNTAFGFTNFTIKMGCTNASSMAASFLSGVQVVYNTANYTPVLGWNNFTLTTPFNWDGKSNIVIEICDDNTASSLSADDIDNTITPYPSVYHIYSYTAPSGCNMFAGAGATDVGSHFLRPKTRFEVCNPPAGTPANFRYTWFPSLYMGNPNAANPRAYVLNSSTYNVMTVDNYGCAHRDSTHIIVSVRNPSLAPKDTAFCLGQILPLRANGGVKYTWSTTDTGVTFNCNGCNNPVVIPTASSTYTVIISDQYNCADTLTSTITVYPTPKIVATPKDTTIFYGGSLQLHASGASEFIWAPSLNLSNPGVSAPVVGPVMEPISYVVYGIDEHNCSNTDTVNINLNYRTPIFVPSAFTPNHDGKNDIFRVGGLTFQKVIEFRVFNRWGQQIFADAGNSGWDGTYNSVMQDIGIYYYLIRVVSPDGYEQTFQGEVSLLR
jgi:gliding motility-associated-like protein